MLRLAFLFGIAYLCLGLAMDGRFRDFPLAVTLLPVLLISLHRLLVGRFDRAGTEERLLAGVTLVCAAVIAIIEGTANPPALAWVGSCALLAVILLLPGRDAQPAEH